MSVNSIGVPSNVFSQASTGIEKSSERIASGSSINSAADNAAGLAIANRMSSQINEFNQSIRNANDGVSMLQTAEGGLSSITESLQRLSELSLRASNGPLNGSERNAINNEAQQIKDEITRTVENSTFNNKNLYTDNDEINIRVGSEEGIDVSGEDFSAILDSISFSGIDLSTSEGATSALSTINELQTQVNNSSADIGAQINRLDSTVNSLYNSAENVSASRSRIEDADLAKEISELTANQLQEDIAISLQTQANGDKGTVLRLLSGL